MNSAEATDPVPEAAPVSPTGVLPLVLSLVAYQVAWLACVREPRLGIGGLGVLAVAVSTVVHLVLFPNRGVLLRGAAAASVWGWLSDAVLMRAGVLVFAAPTAGGWLPPVWMAALWWNFGLVWVAVLGWLSRRPFEAVVFGVVGGPLAYYGGAALGAVRFGMPLPISLAIVAVEWGVTMFVWCVMSGRKVEAA